MNFRAVLLAGACVTALASASYAADLVPMTSVPVPLAPIAYDWSGPYIGVSGAYGTGHSDYIHQNVNNFGGPGGDYNNDVSGWGLGAQAGYNIQFGNFVVGAEGQFIGDNINGEKTYVGINPTTTSLNDLVLATGKIGLVFDNTMIYAKGGYAGGNVTAGQSISTQNTTWSDSEWRNGWTAGVGVAYALTHNVRLNLDYNHVDLGTNNFSAKDSTGTVTTISGHPTAEIFTVGLNYAF